MHYKNIEEIVSEIECLEKRMLTADTNDEYNALERQYRNAREKCKLTMQEDMADAGSKEYYAAREFENAVVSANVKEECIECETSDLTEKLYDDYDRAIAENNTQRMSFIRESLSLIHCCNMYDIRQDGYMIHKNNFIHTGDTGEIDKMLRHSLPDEDEIWMKTESIGIIPLKPKAIMYRDIKWHPLIVFLGAVWLGMLIMGLVVWIT
jgi:hypothetical protein